MYLKQTSGRAGPAQQRNFNRRIPLKTRPRLPSASSDNSDGIVVPLDYYRILQIGPEANTATVQKAYDRLLKTGAPEYYSDEAQLSRTALLKKAAKQLLDADLRQQHDSQLLFPAEASSLDLDPADLRGALVLLQESGDAKATLAVGAGIMDSNISYGERRDVAITMALAHMDLANSCLAAGNVVGKAYEHLEAVIALTDKYRSAPGLHQKATQLAQVRPVHMRVHSSHARVLRHGWCTARSASKDRRLSHLGLVVSGSKINALITALQARRYYSLYHLVPPHPCSLPLHNPHRLATRHAYGCRCATDTRPLCPTPQALAPKYVLEQVQGLRFHSSAALRAKVLTLLREWMWDSRSGASARSAQQRAELRTQIKQHLTAAEQVRPHAPSSRSIASTHLLS